MNLTHKIKNICYLLILTLFPALGLQSCYDDLGVNPDGVDENFTGITLMIPDTDGAAEFGATRSDGHANTRAYDMKLETNFNTLYIVAIDSQGTLHVFQKSQYDRIDRDYKVYNIALDPGNYNFYVVSNLNRYLFDDSGASTTFSKKVNSESEIRQLILNFSSNIPLEPGFLPMACLHENIKVGEPSNEKQGSVDNPVEIVKGSPKKIYADLDFLCAKVRYTILFDRSKAPDFGTTDIIDFNRNTADDKPFASKLRKSTAIDSENTSVTADYIRAGTSDDAPLATWMLYLDRYKFPSFNSGSNIYDLDPVNDKNEIKDGFNRMQLWTTSDGSWSNNTDQRAWQGVAYLPENLVKNLDTDEELLTALNFPYTFNGDKGAESPRKINLKWENNGENEKEYGLKRATSYDVYALINTPDPAGMTVSVLINPWTLQNLAYELHGPYELIVETTKIPVLSMQQDAVFWFRSADVPPNEIYFESPQVSITGNPEDPDSMRDIFIGEVLKNTDGSYALNDNGDYQYRVSLNTEIPYSIFYKFISGDKINEGYQLSDISFFHLVAGSLHKRIEIENLDLNPYLEVNPQTIIIDARELYTSANDTISHYITFETNVTINPEDTSVSLTLSDPEKLISEGKGDGSPVLQLDNPQGYAADGDIYNLTASNGYFKLNVWDIILGNPYWNENNEYKLTFTLDAPGLEEPIVKTVTIKVRPFSGSYTIHFRDNTKEWDKPHVYIFQDLTLPSDMMVRQPDGSLVPYENAGKIVGYVEQNPTSGLQWNAAVQYLFTNNVSFKGWHGNHIAVANGTNSFGQTIYDPEAGDEYGGPDINNPWAAASCINSAPTSTTGKPDTTYGFVMFGEPYTAKGSEGWAANTDFWFWNYDYSYNTTYMLVPNEKRDQRYYYDVNFNSEHEKGYYRWSCSQCQNYGDYNQNKTRFYTGIAMEREEGENEGWWKYTLTGVAQPGRTVVIFANWHEPWNERLRDFRAEDYRWPGDYEAGLPLFDFEDNEGWFLFDGNTLNTDQRFTDERPTAKELPHKFDASNSSQMTVEVKIPTAGADKVTSVTLNGVSGTKGTVDNERGVVPFTFSQVNGTTTSIDAVVTVDGVSKTYPLNPKFFKRSGRGYTTAQPLYWEYTDGIEMYVKWNDEVAWQDWWLGDGATDNLLDYYDPEGGHDYLAVYWGSDANSKGTRMKSYYFGATGYRVIGNYKHIIFKTESTPANQSALKLYLGIDEDGNVKRTNNQGRGSNGFYKVIKVEDLPSYYYPDYDNYLINWHLVERPDGVR